MPALSLFFIFITIMATYILLIFTILLSVFCLSYSSFSLLSMLLLLWLPSLLLLSVFFFFNIFILTFYSRIFFIHGLNNNFLEPRVYWERLYPTKVGLRSTYPPSQTRITLDMLLLQQYLFQYYCLHNYHMSPTFIPNQALKNK